MRPLLSQRCQRDLLPKSFLIFAGLSVLGLRASFGQDGKIVSREKFADLRKSAAYADIGFEEGGGRRLKPEYEYLNRVGITKMTYLSHGLKINGFIIAPLNEGKV